jgi:hypothetical protein
MRTYNPLLLGALALGLGACQGAQKASPTTFVQPTTTTLSPSPSPSSTETKIYTPPPSPTPVGFLKIDRHPEGMLFHRGALTALPAYDPNSADDWQVDLRSYDLSGLDLRTSLKDLLFADFDDKTIWPSADKMPAGFDPHQIMELGKNPGLNIQTLHQEGITGKNIGIAIIDQPMLVDHQEYADRVLFYEEAADAIGYIVSFMHGPAVASIAVGKTVGVAPDANLYYISTRLCNTRGSYESNDYSCLAKSVRRIIEINRQLPTDRKIRVLSISVGWDSTSEGYAEITAAVQEAKNAGIFIICSSESEIYGFNFDGLGRPSLSDPNDFQSYEPGLFWGRYFYSREYVPVKTLMVPMDSRTTASPTGAHDYVFYREGGWSWSIPYLAGMYALAAQVKPDITPELFWSTALSTGRTIQIPHGEKTYSFGVILDPVALIHALKS